MDKYSYNNANQNNQNANQNVNNQNNAGREHLLGMRSPKAQDQGPTEIRKYDRYYNRDNTIKVAGPTTTPPPDPESTVYNEENVYDVLGGRRAETLWITNHGTDDLFYRESHTTYTNFSPELVVHPGDEKELKNIYALRLRSPTVGLPYSLNEGRIMKTCCPSASGTTNVIITGQPISVSLASGSSALPIINTRGITPTWVHAAEVTAPGAGTVLVTKTVGAGKSGFIYGFMISVQEANNFLINWTSGGVAESIRIVFPGAGSIEDSEDMTPINEGLPADTGTAVTITNVSAAGAGKIYQARLKYAEQ